MRGAQNPARVPDPRGPANIPVVEEVGYQPLEQAEANLVFRIIAKRYLNNR